MIITSNKSQADSLMLKDIALIV